MAGSTPNLDLYLPGGGSTNIWTPDEVADIDPLNNNFLKIDEAIGDPDEQNRNWFGPAASIGTIPDRPPRKGDTYTASDTEQVWRHTGSNWVTAEQGMFLIRPGGTNGEILPNGHVTAPAGSQLLSIELQNCFTTRFRRYMVVADWNAFGGANGITIQFMNGAAVDDGNNYFSQVLAAFGTSVSTNGGTVGTGMSGVGVAGVDHAAKWMFYTPAEAGNRSRMTYEHAVINSGTGYSAGGGGNMLMKAHDGVSFRLSTTPGRYFSPGEMTDFAVYGYA